MSADTALVALRSAAQQALTELRLCRSLLDDGQSPEHVAANMRAASAIRALVSALAQPEPCRYPSCQFIGCTAAGCYEEGGAA